MADQSFSPENLKSIYDNENKKGKYLEGEFFPHIKEISKAIKNLRKNIYILKKRRANISPAGFNIALTALHSKLKAKKEERNSAVMNVLSAIGANISQKSFSLKCIQAQVVHGKATYKIEKNENSFFAEKKLQENIKKTYNINLSSRDSIVSSLISILDDDMPKIIIRTDISSFYESISHDLLKLTLERHGHLSLSTKRIINETLKFYTIETGSSRGLPRGIGISAYLSEVFMIDIDDEILKLPHIIYYKRYVDDIIAIFSPPIKIDETLLMQDIERIINNHKLTLNKIKTKTINTLTQQNYTLDYLGYQFKHANKKTLDVEISNQRKLKIESRIDYSFQNYIKGRKTEKTKRLFINRIKFLTGNIKLTNNKGGTFIGIYHTNKFANNTSQIKNLDNILRDKINTELRQSPSLQRRLNKLSFEDGFNKKTYRKFTTKELMEITKGWC
ncbi:RNA-directed DNA polymerase [Aeromonas caviae]|uniref:antiviral reverse transcriptase Drt3a n=1 Tax=Aeromonas caviae TaxID=648 RepID=UPI001F460017|nr:antiviral reverse transcriptase Drt3a [Aeromonas caviae]WKS86350.1 RNA-directed DNA polymerase [Aeromonas caviae]BDC86321.1 hypothetical protein NUITMVA2_16780 [Aeromonas caviae]